MASSFPVYDIGSFGKKEKDIYSNTLKQHLRAHSFTGLPHKHDFFLVVLVSKGSGTHEIDFVKHKVKPRMLFILKPGQMHHWKFSPETDGFVFFHSLSFYEGGARSVYHFPFFSTFQSTPQFILPKASFEKTEFFMRELDAEFKLNDLFREKKIRALIDMVYIELSRIHVRPSSHNKTSGKYLDKLHKFELLLDKKFSEMKTASQYAARLNITEKHLNRIVRDSLNKTTTQLIAERIILEARRMLMHSGFNVNQIAAELGFADTSYFIRFFKKNSGETPLAFVRRYHSKRQR